MVPDLKLVQIIYGDDKLHAMVKQKLPSTTIAISPSPNEEEESRVGLSFLSYVLLEDVLSRELSLNDYHNLDAYQEYVDYLT